METVLLKINDEKAYKLLEGLEDLQVITVLKKNTESKQKLSEKYGGKLSCNVADELNNYINKSREEWNNSSI